MDVIADQWRLFVPKLITDKMVFLCGDMFEDSNPPVRYVSNALVNEKWRIGERVSPVPQDIFDGKGIADPIEKLRAIARCYEGKSPVVISWIPSVVIQFAQVRKEIYSLPLTPQIVIVWWCRVQPYVSQLRELFGRSCTIIPYYNATEWSFAYQPKHLRDTDDFDTLELMTDHGVYYEFVEHISDQNQIISIDEIEPNIWYRLIISTFDGLCRYQIGDVIEFSDVNRLYFRITGRTSEYIDVANEHCQIEHVKVAMQPLLEQYIIRRYSVYPLQWTDQIWYYQIVCETDDMIDEVDFVARFDEWLCVALHNYSAKRKGGTLWLPQLTIVPSWSFDHIIHQRNIDTHSGQSKLMTLYPTPDNPVAHYLSSSIT